MRLTHLETFSAGCPSCLERGVSSGLELEPGAREVAGHVVQGVLQCTSNACRSRHLILDGVPFLLPEPARRLAPLLDQLLLRDDLDPGVEAVVAEAAPTGSTFDIARQHLSMYAWDHHGDHDTSDPSSTDAGSVLTLLHRGLELARPLPHGPWLDLGCATGRVTFALADRTDTTALGIDLSPIMLRTASRVLREGRVRYGRRRVGIVHDAREFDVALPGADRVDFWACDVTALPLRSGVAGGIVALNLLDCVTSPVRLLAEIARLLAPGGRAVVSTPYDWSASATLPEAWLGGRSPAGPDGGASVPALKRLLDGGGGAPNGPLAALRLVAEDDGVPWRVRLHERATMVYSTHVLVLEKLA